MTTPAITYKPGWSFSWEEHDDRWFLRIVVTRPDPKGWDSRTGEERIVEFLLLPPLPFDPAWLRQELGEIENHEIDEWLKVDRILVFEPHFGSPQGHVCPECRVDPCYCNTVIEGPADKGPVFVRWGYDCIDCQGSFSTNDRCDCCGGTNRIPVYVTQDDAARFEDGS